MPTPEAGPAPTDGDAALLRDQVAKWEEIGGWVCRVDGEGPLDQAVEIVLSEAQA